MTMEESRALLKNITVDMTPRDEDSVLEKKEEGHSDTLGKKLLTAEDLEGVTRIGEEEVRDQVASSLNTETLATARRVGGEADGGVTSNLGADCKENPEEDTTVEHFHRNDETGDLISSGREEIPTDRVESFRD